MTKKFNCSKCGLCCEIVAPHVPELKEFLNENNECKHYDKENKLCKIYENRPDICNVDKGYKYLKFDERMSKEEYLELNYKCCKELVKLYGKDI